MLTADTIGELAAAGLSAEQIALVATIVERLFADVTRKSEERRRKDAERKRKSREVPAKESSPHTPFKENITPLVLPPTKERFEEWWESYPLKKSKGRARKVWGGALKKTSAEVLIAAAKTYAARQVGQDPKYIKHPATWLNDEAWIDADLAIGAANGSTGFVTPSRHSPQPGETRAQWLNRTRST